jgi:protein-disulfide isomerase
MLVQLLTVRHCPHAEPAAAVVRQALDEAGLTDVPVTGLTIDSQAEADRLGFLGSPTILINGRDPFPGAGHRPALARRLYQHPTGLSGVLPIRPIRLALDSA